MATTAIANPDDQSGKPGRYRSISAHEHFGVQSTRTSELPDPVNFLKNLTQRGVEVLLGWRDLAQIARWVTDDVYLEMKEHVNGLRRKSSVMPPEARNPQRLPLSLTTMRLTEPRDGIIEACVMLSVGKTPRVAAVRIEGLDRRWRASCFALL